ncbi:MAG: hypothetical protein IT373_01875 [Polyangiaceae bacterium]|nr:hypothetical protein [Polyangiaceae bacterium]
MPRYRLYGITLASEVALETLHAASCTAGEGDEGDVQLALRAPAPPEPVEHWDFERVWAGDDEPWLSVAERGGGLLVRAHGRADFAVDRAGRTLVVRPWPGCSWSQLEELLLDQVLPQVLHLRGELALHASAVALDGVALAFVGMSGSGKSTLAAALGRGLADDCLVVRALVGGELAPLEAPAERAAGGGPIVPFAVPGYPALRLRPDVAAAAVGAAAADAAPRTATGKLRVAVPPATPLPLAGIAVLEAGTTEPQLERSSRRDALAELVRHVHRLLPGGHARLTRELDAFAALVAAVPVWRLRVPRGFEATEAVRSILRRALGEGRP